MQKPCLVGQEYYLAPSFEVMMQRLILLILCSLATATFAQEAGTPMTKEEKIAAAKAKAKAEGDTAAVVIKMTPYEEAAKLFTEAMALEGQRLYDEAQAAYDKSIEIDPNFIEAYVKRGGIKFQKIEFPAAMEDYNRAVEIAENLTEMHEYKASIKNVLGDFEGSKIEGSKADYMKTRMAEALFHRGHLKRFMEDNGGGCADLRKSLELGYGRAKTDWPSLCQ